MRRRAFLALLGAAGPMLAWSRAAGAQASSGVPRIGFLTTQAAGAPYTDRKALVEGLRALGYVEGKTIEIVDRSANGDESALPRLATELVALDVAVIVALAPPLVLAAQAATGTIPIVMRTTIDPVRAGFTTSLAHPDRNITGVSSASGALYAKRLELLKELVPGLSRVAVLRNEATPTGQDYLADVKDAARTLGLALDPVSAEHPADFADAFEAGIKAGAQALLPLRDPTVVRNRRLIAELALAHRLPAIYDDRQFVDVGGLASYGADLAALHRRAAYYVDRILKGAKPADLPIEQPTRFELVINQRTATAMEFAIPPSIMLRADEVIE